MKKNIFNQIEQAVYDNKLFYKQRFIDLQDQFNLNIVSDILNNFERKNSIKTPLPINIHDVFSHTFQIKGVEQHPSILPINNIIVNNLKKCDVDRADMFISFKKTSGPSHVDEENSLILSIYNTTIYHFPDDNTTILMQPGDILLVPTGRIHFASSYQARLILSWGLYKK